MKYLALAALLISNICNAQNKSDSLFFAKMEKTVIKVDNAVLSVVDFPFKDLIIWDVRSDTGSIGFIKYDSHTKEINFENGLSSEIYAFAKRNYTFNAGDTNAILVIIKDFRLSNYADENYIKDDNVTVWSPGIILNAELFLFNNNGYHALYKFDTTFITGNIFNFSNHISSEVFHLIFSKIENKDFTGTHIGKKEFSWEQMQQHANENTNLPILKDSILHKGVYRSFAEFKNNKPSIENFEIGKGNFTDELYVADNHETYPLQDFWGYCDGKNLFVRSANNLFQLYRTGNTFNTKAFKSLKKAKYSIGAAAEQIGIGLLTRTAGDLILINPKNPQDKYRVVTSAFQLNMQTGEIF